MPPPGSGVDCRGTAAEDDTAGIADMDAVAEPPREAALVANTPLAPGVVDTIPMVTVGFGSGKSPPAALLVGDELFIVADVVPPALPLPAVADRRTSKSLLDRARDELPTERTPITVGGSMREGRAVVVDPLVPLADPFLAARRCCSASSDLASSSICFDKLHNKNISSTNIRDMRGEKRHWNADDHHQMLTSC